MPSPGSQGCGRSSRGRGDGAEGLAGDSARRHPPSCPTRTHPPLPGRKASASKARARTALPLPPAPGTENSTGGRRSPEVFVPEVTHEGVPPGRRGRGCALGLGMSGGSLWRAGERGERKGGGRRRRASASPQNRTSRLGTAGKQQRNSEANDLEVTRGTSLADAGWPGCHGNRLLSREIGFLLFWGFFCFLFFPFFSPRQLSLGQHSAGEPGLT